MEWEEYGGNSNWEEHPFLKNMFRPHWKEKHPKTYVIPSCIHVSSSLMIFGEDAGGTHAAGGSLLFWIP